MGAVRTAADARKRLQQSKLFQRRQWDAAKTKAFAVARAHWYLSPKFTPRWEATK